MTRALDWQRFASWGDVQPGRGNMSVTLTQKKAQTMPQKMSPAEFQKALTNKTLKNPLVLQGLAKESDDAKSIMFSQDGCTTWTAVPVELIEDIDFLGDVACKDHSHPLVRLNLKRPTGDGLVFSNLLEGLLSHVRRSSSRPQPAAQSPNPPSAAARSRRDSRRSNRPRGDMERTYYVAGCRAQCYNSAYNVYGEGASYTDCNLAWDACFDDLDYECSGQGGVVLSTRVGTYCEEG